MCPRPGLPQMRARGSSRGPRTPSGCPPDSSEGKPKGTVSFVTGARLNFMKTSLNVEIQIWSGSVCVSVIYDDRGLSCDDLSVVVSQREGGVQAAGRVIRFACRTQPAASPSPSWASLSAVFCLFPLLSVLPRTRIWVSSCEDIRMGV